jgi:hypothetical protein
LPDFEGFADFDHGANDSVIPHPHRAENCDSRTNAGSQIDIYADEREFPHSRVRIFEANVNADAAAGRFQKAVEQGKNAILFFKRAKQIAHPLPSQVQIEPYKI